MFHEWHILTFLSEDTKYGFLEVYFSELFLILLISLLFVCLSFMLQAFIKRSMNVYSHLRIRFWKLFGSSECMDGACLPGGISSRENLVSLDKPQIWISVCLFFHFISPKKNPPISCLGSDAWIPGYCQHFGHTPRSGFCTCYFLCLVWSSKYPYGLLLHCFHLY